jgi:hypothetical protein
LDTGRFGIITLHEQLSFTFEGCADNEGLNDVHGFLLHYSPFDLTLVRDLPCERVFISPPWEMADKIGQAFKNCRHLSQLDISFSEVGLQPIGSCTKSSMHALICLLDSRLRMLRPIRQLRKLLDHYNYG